MYKSKCCGAPLVKNTGAYNPVCSNCGHHCDIEDDERFSKNKDDLAKEIKMNENDNIKLSEYWEILGKVFEWICYESNVEVSLSYVCKVNGKYEPKTIYNANLYKSELCIATMQDSLKFYDKEHKTDYYNTIMDAIDKTKKGIPLVSED